MKEDIQNFIDTYNSIYLSKGIISHPPIKLYFRDHNYKEMLEPNNYKKYNVERNYEHNCIYSITFNLKHKSLDWLLYYRYHLDEDYNYTDDLRSSVTTEGINISNDEYASQYFETLQEGQEYIKDQVIKTYEKFQNL